MKKQNKMIIKYAPSIVAASSFLLLLVLNMLLFFGRKYDALRPEFLLNNFADFYQHVSNFSISFSICTAIGFMWLMMGVPFRYIAAMCIAVIFFNAVYELFIPVLNTRDITDAYYGIAGTLLAFVFLAVLHKRGLKQMPQPNT